MLKCRGSPSAGADKPPACPAGKKPPAAGSSSTPAAGDASAAKWGRPIPAPARRSRRSWSSWVNWPATRPRRPPRWPVGCRSHRRSALLKWRRNCSFKNCTRPRQPRCARLFNLPEPWKPRQPNCLARARPGIKLTPPGYNSPSGSDVQTPPEQSHFSLRPRFNPLTNRPQRPA